MELFTKLLRYMAWADERTLAALRHQPASHAEALPLFGHILAGEHVWLCRVTGQKPRLDGVWPTLSVEECAALARDNATGYQALLRERGEAGLGTVIYYKSLAGQEFETPMGDILLHVVTHGHYHRGQVSKAMARAGGSRVDADYIVFTREAQP